MLTNEDLKIANQKAKEYDKSIKVIRKTGWFGRLLGNLGMILLTLITLGIGSKGKKWKEKFMTRFYSTIGHVILVGSSATLDGFLWVLTHEARHVKQYRFFGLGIHPLIGFPGMLITYGLLPIPIFGAFGRVYLEMDAERARWKQEIPKWEDKNYIINFFRTSSEEFAKTVAGSMYFYSMPISFVKWYFKRKLEETIHECT